MSDESSPARLRRATPARIGLGRSGAGLPTSALLAFQLDHALARDAVHHALDVEAVARPLPGSLAQATLLLESAAHTRADYLAHPDLGRRLSERSRAVLESKAASPCDAALVVVDGLSAVAVENHAVALACAILQRLESWNWAPTTIVRQGRVAVGDEVGALLGANLVLVLIGERPGLSSPDSLGAYLTWSPRVGRSDAERNCVSNIRRPHGLSPEQAADKLAWLMVQARHRRLTGTALKDEHGALPPSPHSLSES